MTSAPEGRLRLAVDAGALARDRRGMGRVVRATLRCARADPACHVTLLARDADARALRAEFLDVDIEAPASAKQHGRYDVVWYPFNGMRFRSAAPALVTMHDAFAFTEPHPKRIARLREQAPIRRAAREAVRVMAVSAWTRHELARELHLVEDSIAVVHSAPDQYFFPGSGDLLPAPLDARRFVLVVGVREARKNARLAIDACALALRAPSETLVVVGELGQADRERARRAGVPAGEIAANDVTLRALYRNAAVVLVPSLAEGFGLVALEALACGAPVLASNRSALPEATAGAAELLDPADAAAWATAIRSLLDDPLRAAMLGARGAAHFAGADRSAGARGTLALLRETAQVGIDRRPRA